MASLVKRILSYLLPVPLGVLRNCRTLAFGYGQAKSIRAGSPVDAAGNPIAWYTYPALEHLSQYDFSARNVFEYGCGFSSLFWAQRAKLIVSVEHDEAWFHRIRNLGSANLRIHLQQDQERYIRFPLEQGIKFDIIAIDGKWRHACAAAAPGALEEGGLIVFDNADWYPAATRHLRSQGFFQFDFSGFGPINAYAWTTSIFLKAATRMQENLRSPAPIGRLAVEAQPTE